MPQLPEIPQLPKISKNESNNNNNNNECMVNLPNLNAYNKDWLDFIRYIVPAMSLKKEVISEDIENECLKYGISIDALPRNAYYIKCPNNQKCKHKYNCDKNHTLLERAIGVELKSMRVKCMCIVHLHVCFCEG